MNSQPMNTSGINPRRNRSAAFCFIVFCVAALLFSSCMDGQQTGTDPDFRLNLNAPEVEGLSVTVNGGVAVPVERIQWNWGDGLEDPHLFFPATHTYARPGHYTITVSVFDHLNRSAAQSITLNLQQ